MMTGMPQIHGTTRVAQSMTKQKQLDAMVKKVSDDLLACEKFADENNLSFSFSHPSHYGFSDTFTPKSLRQESSRRYYNMDDEDEREEFENMTGRWLSSSANC